MTYFPGNKGIVSSILPSLLVLILVIKSPDFVIVLSSTLISSSAYIPYLMSSSFLVFFSHSSLTHLVVLSSISRFQSKVFGIVIISNFSIISFVFLSLYFISISCISSSLVIISSSLISFI